MPQILYSADDITKPQGPSPKIVAHICNDSGDWGSGPAAAISKRWPGAKGAYLDWPNGPIPIKLGFIQVVEVSSDQYVANMVTRAGHRSAKHPAPSSHLSELSYPNLRVCLDKLSIVAREKNASVHLPRIASELEGADWDQIERIINDTLISAGVAVTVYDPPVKTRAPRTSPTI